MTKKLLGLSIGALFCSLTIHASTLVPCTPSGLGVTNGGTGVANPTISGSVVCGGLTVNPSTGFYISEYDWTVQNNTYDGGNPNTTQTIVYSYSTSGFTGATSETDTVTGGAGPTGGTETGACSSVSSAPAGLAFDCEGTTTPNQSTVGAFTVTVSTSWLGTGNLEPTGDEQVNIYFSYTLTPIVSTPEPASLLMIGGGLIGLASLLRRKKA